MAVIPQLTSQYSSMFKTILLVSLFLFYSCAGFSNEVVSLAGRDCKHGLNQHPTGSFGVFVFCDDGLGTQIGVILTKPGLGPVAEQAKWRIANRFWQNEELWTINVKQLVWSKSGNFIYVTTSEVYSDESLYEIDLKNQLATKLLDGKKLKQYVKIEKATENTIKANGKTFQIRQ